MFSQQSQSLLWKVTSPSSDRQEFEPSVFLLGESALSPMHDENDLASIFQVSCHHYQLHQWFRQINPEKIYLQKYHEWKIFSEKPNCMQSHSSFALRKQDRVLIQSAKPLVSLQRPFWVVFLADWRLFGQNCSFSRQKEAFYYYPLASTLGLAFTLACFFFAAISALSRYFSTFQTACLVFSTLSLQVFLKVQARKQDHHTFNEFFQIAAQSAYSSFQVPQCLQALQKSWYQFTLTECAHKQWTEQILKMLSAREPSLSPPLHSSVFHRLLESYESQLQQVASIVGPQTSIVFTAPIDNKSTQKAYLEYKEHFKILEDQTKTHLVREKGLGTQTLVIVDFPHVAPLIASLKDRGFNVQSSEIPRITFQPI